jgi:hypothetical protein
MDWNYIKMKTYPLSEELALLLCTKEFLRSEI